MLEDPALSRAHLQDPFVQRSGRPRRRRLAERHGDRGAPCRAGPGATSGRGSTRPRRRTLFTVLPRPAEPATPPDARGGFIGFNRTMRVVSKLAPLERRIPAPPDDQQRYGRVGLLASLPFALLGVVLWQITGSATMLVFIAITPMMAVMSFIEERSSRKRGLAHGRQKYRRSLAELQGELETAWLSEIAYRRQAAPAAPELLDRARRHLDSLWERSRSDHDFAALRLGSADQPSGSKLVLEQGGSELLREEAERLLAAYASVPSVPVTVPLAEVGAVGLCGSPRPRLRAGPLPPAPGGDAAQSARPRDRGGAVRDRRLGLAEMAPARVGPHGPQHGVPGRRPAERARGRSSPCCGSARSGMPRRRPSCRRPMRSSLRSFCS